MKNDIKVALISQEKIGKNMAGSAIRYFELAKILSKYFEVTLFSTAETDMDSSALNFEIMTYDKSSRRNHHLANYLKKYTHIIAQELAPDIISSIKKNKIKLIADLYDPLPIEIVEHTKNYNFLKRLTIRARVDISFQMQLLASDHVLCSNLRQVSLYRNMAKKLGFNLAEKRISLLPFGLSDKSPVYTNEEMIENLFPGILPSDKIVLWGGGIWNWFDALSVIKSIERIYKRRKDIKLVFMGAKNKHFDNLQDKNLQTILNYCDKNDLQNNCVFFNFDWVPYTDRVNFLLKAKICVSIHYKSKETYYSFRTRILDYIWAKKPIVCTEGDVFSELIEKKQLGKVVRYENIDDIEESILELVDQPDLYKKIINNIQNITEDYTWYNITKELVGLIQIDSIKSQELNRRAYQLLKLKFFFWAGLQKISRMIGYE